MARNFAEGHGFSVNHMYQFYRDYPSVTHAEDTWPLLEPLMVSLSFRLLGESSFAAKLPNLSLLGPACVTVWAASRRLVGPRLSLVPARLLVTTPSLNGEGQGRPVAALGEHGATGNELRALPAGPRAHGLCVGKGPTL